MPNNSPPECTNCLKTSLEVRDGLCIDCLAEQRCRIKSALHEHIEGMQMWGLERDQLKAENERLKAEAIRLRTTADAWFEVIRLGNSFPDFGEDDPLSDEDKQWTEEHVEKYEAAKEHAHKLDPGRRCPECKGQHGYVAYGGFVPCPYCDTNDWAEILEESKHEEAYLLKAENERLSAQNSTAIAELAKCSALNARNQERTEAWKLAANTYGVAQVKAIEAARELEQEGGE